MSSVSMFQLLKRLGTNTPAFSPLSHLSLYLHPTNRFAITWCPNAAAPFRLWFEAIPRPSDYRSGYQGKSGTGLISHRARELLPESLSTKTQFHLDGAHAAICLYSPIDSDFFFAFQKTTIQQKRWEWDCWGPVYIAVKEKRGSEPIIWSDDDTAESFPYWPLVYDKMRRASEEIEA